MLAPDKDDNKASAGKGLDLAHCVRHSDARPLFERFKGTLVTGFPYGFRAAEATPPSAYPSTAEGGQAP